MASSAGWFAAVTGAGLADGALDGACASAGSGVNIVETSTRRASRAEAIPNIVNPPPYGQAATGSILCEPFRARWPVCVNVAAGVPCSARLP
jgi:hypothetical protein